MRFRENTMSEPARIRLRHSGRSVAVQITPNWRAKRAFRRVSAKHTRKISLAGGGSGTGIRRSLNLQESCLGKCDRGPTAALKTSRIGSEGIGFAKRRGPTPRSSKRTRSLESAALSILSDGPFGSFATKRMSTGTLCTVNRDRTTRILSRPRWFERDPLSVRRDAEMAVQDILARRELTGRSVEHEATGRDDVDAVCD